MIAPSDSPSLLTVISANKTYSGIPALIDASLDLRAGEVHALMGENGAGKSTLIKILAGVLQPDSIQINRGARSVVIRHAHDAFDLGLRFIHQELNIVPHLSVAENIFLSQPYPTRAGVFVNWKALNERARSVLAHLGVSHISPNRQMARLSPGDQMLVSIARAFMGNEAGGESPASVYVMDEPTASLSGQETAMLFNVIDGLRGRGCAVLYVSHRLDEIFKIADWVTVMRDGRVVDSKPIHNVTPADLIRMMTGRALEQVYPIRETPYGERILLDVRDLASDFIREVTFQLKEGEILGIAGLNGAGRTEVLRALMGADRLRAGQATLDGQSLGHLSATAAWNKGIAFLPEERRSQGLVMSRSISNNVTLPQLRYFSRGALFLDHNRERQTALSMGESVRLKSNGPAQTVRQLSGGNQQKVVFAKALARPPRLLLLDEPTRGVDVGAKADIYALIRQISAKGAGIIMVSSDLPELIGLTDRILIMRGGSLVDMVPTAGLTEEKLLALCYGEIQHDHQ
ncbi:MAG: sugar ABC transporter ATP-binding protein [Chloroflexota bacterium]